MATLVTTGKVRFSYLKVFTPSAAPGSDKLKYSTSILIDKKDKATLDKVRAAIAEAKAEGKSKCWGGKVPSTLKLPLRDGDEEKSDDEAYKGKYFINCSSQTKPGVVDKDLNPILDPDEIYSGCYGRVNINFYPFAVNGNKGVAAGLNHVQKLADGESLGGSGVSVEAAFADGYDDDEEEDYLD